MQQALFNIEASQTEAVLIGGVSGKRVIVHGALIVSGPNPTSLTFNSTGSRSSIPISPTFQCGANSWGTIPPLTGLDGWFKTNVGEGLTVTTGAGSTTGIQLLYDVQ